MVVAHPDDEAFGCGSVLARAARMGMRTAVLCATRGELGEPAPGSGIVRADLGRVREAELRAGCGLLGVDRVDLLDFTDSGVSGDPVPGSLANADPVHVQELVAAHIDELRPDVVVTLDASDGHRDHAIMRDAMLAATTSVDGHQPDGAYLFCLARSLMTRFTGSQEYGTPDELITSEVDVSDLLDVRWRAIRAHASQVPPFDAMPPDLQYGFLATDRLRRVIPEGVVGRDLDLAWLY